MSDCLDDDSLNDDPNVIGNSSLPYCQRKLVISKNNNIKFFDNSKMLFGSTFQNAFEKSNVLSKVLETINKQLGLNPKHQIVRLKRHDYEQLIQGYYLRYSPDTYTNYYILEEKTTAIPVNTWREDKNKKSQATHQVSQLNSYLGKYRINLGFLLRINIRAYLSQISTKNSYWEKLCHDYQQFVPWQFNLEMYKATKLRAKIVLEHVKEKRFTDLIGPEFNFECEDCDLFVRKKCGREEYKCQQCKKNALYEYPSEITSEFSNKPLCQNCFEKQYPRNKYLKYKLSNYKEIE